MPGCVVPGCVGSVRVGPCRSVSVRFASCRVGSRGPSRRVGVVSRPSFVVPCGREGCSGRSGRRSERPTGGGAGRVGCRRVGWRVPPGPVDALICSVHDRYRSAPRRAGRGGGRQEGWNLVGVGVREGEAASAVRSPGSLCGGVGVGRAPGACRTRLSSTAHPVRTRGRRGPTLVRYLAVPTASGAVDHVRSFPSARSARSAPVRPGDAAGDRGTAPPRGRAGPATGGHARTVAARRAVPGADRRCRSGPAVPERTGGARGGRAVPAEENGHPQGGER